MTTYASPETASAAFPGSHVNKDRPGVPLAPFLAELAPSVTGLPGGLPVMPEDLNAAHQIVITVSQKVWPGQIVVSCTCLGSKGHWRQPIAMHPVFPAAAAVSAWRAWHTENGIAV